MFKKSSIRKICLASFCLLILLIIYLFPKSKPSESLKIKTEYKTGVQSDVLFLLNDNDYVSRINVVLKGEDVSAKALELIDYMTINSPLTTLVPNGFKAIFPENTKVLSYDLNDKNFKVNFSADILNVSEKDEMHMVEALVYSLTTLEGIKSITILVNGEILNRLPHSLEYLPNPIDRSYGINKTYDINKIKGMSKTTMYYIASSNDNYYYIPVTKVTNDNNEKIEIIIKELASSPVYETSLMSYLNSATTLQKYEFLDKELNLDFNNSILSDVTHNDILEEVTYAINLSIKDNYDVDTVFYSVNDEKVATFDLKSLE